MFVRVQKYPQMNSDHLNHTKEIHTKEIDALFSSLLSNPRLRGNVELKVDVVDGQSSTVIVAEVPGVMKEDVNISLHENILTLSGERKSTPRPEGSKKVTNEIRVGTFSRSIRLPHQVDLNAITAELANGMVKVTLPKAEEAKPRTITIK